MGRNISIPARVQIGNPTLLANDEWIDDAFRRGLSRTLAQSSEAVGAGDGPILAFAPEIQWTGPGAGQVSAEDQSRVEQRVREVVDEALQEHGISPPSGTTPTTTPSWRTATNRPWIVLRSSSIRMNVDYYFSYLNYVVPSLDDRDMWIDYWHEERRVTVWWVRLNVPYVAEDINREVVERIDELNPLGENEISAWASTPYERDKQELLFLAGVPIHAADTRDFDQHNRYLVAGSGNTATYDAGTWLLFTRMKLPGLPQITTAPGQEEFFWETMRTQLLEGDRQTRAAAAEMLVALRVYPRALEILYEALERNTLETMGSRLAVLSALEDWPGFPKPYSILLLVLYAVDNSYEHTPRRIFEDWFKINGGRTVVEFLERVFAELSEEWQVRASRLILHLLHWARDEEAAPYQASITRLRTFIRDYELDTDGVLGAESLRVLCRDQKEVILDLLRVISRNLEESPYSDPYRDDDRQTIALFRTAVGEYFERLDSLQMEELSALHANLTTIVTGLNDIISRIEGLHTGIRRIREFMQGATTSDEITVLFNLRHSYIEVVNADLLENGGIARALAVIDIDSDNFSQTVAEYKWARARRDFNRAHHDVMENEILTQWNGSGPIQSDTWRDMKRILEHEMSELWETFHPPEVRLGNGTRITLDDGSGSGLNSLSTSHPINLNQAVNIETRVAIFGVRVAMFSHFSVSLILENQVYEHEIGNATFRTSITVRLEAIRQEIAHDWNGNGQDYQHFIDRYDAIGWEFEDIQRDIKREVREAIAIELLITAAAALVTAGVGLLVRAALVGRTISVIRTARAVNTLVFLSEVGAFSATQLAGESLAFDRPITLERATTTTLQNLVMFGGFRLLGRLTGPLIERGGYGFVAGHSINLGATAIPTVFHGITTGEWPDDIGLFLTHMIGSYVVFMGVSHATRAGLSQITNPIIEGRIRASVQRLDASNADLIARLQTASRTGTLTREQFEQIKSGMRSNISDAVELARQLTDAGIRSVDDYRSLHADLMTLDGIIASMEFRAPRGYLTSRNGVDVIEALPTPIRVRGLVSQGEPNLYYYSRSQENPEVDAALVRYDEAGFRVERFPSGMIRVTRPNGEIAFILEPLLQLETSSTPPRLPSLIERVLGRGYLPETEIDTVTEQLRQINPRIIQVLEAEFQDPTVLSTLRLFTRNFPNAWEFWPIDAVRGVATALQVQRGIGLRPIYRMFETQSQADLIEAFSLYRNVADMPRGNGLISPDLTPSTSITLIRAYARLRSANLQLPEDMSNRALMGLLRWVTEGRDIVQELGSIRTGNRLARLEADSPIVDPRIQPTTRTEQILQRHALDIRPGLNLLDGTVAEVADAIEALGQQHGGRLSDTAVRTELERLIQGYRTRVSDFQAGQNVERNLEGEREEIHTIIAALELGAEVFSIGNIRTIYIQPSHYPLARGYTLINAPDNVPIQLDVGARRISGRFVMIEATTGELTLPTALRGLDPESGLPENGTVDWSALNSGNASHRKWMQIIKMRAAALFGRDLGIHWGNNPSTELPELILSAGGVSAPARRALEAMDFTVE